MPSFQNPEAFLLLILIPLVFILRKAGIFSRISFFLTLGDWNGEFFKWNFKIRKFASILSHVFIILSYILCVFALAKPVLYRQERVFTSRGNDIVFVLDVSPSMAAKDIVVSVKKEKQSRIEAAKESIVSILSSNPGSSFALIAMAKDAAVLVPPTCDHEYFLNRLNEVQIAFLGDGTAIGVGLSTAVFHLISSKAEKKAVVLITDGENNCGEIHPEVAAELAKNHGISLYTLGVGFQGTSRLEYVDPKTGKIVSGSFNSSFDSASLKKLSSIAGGRYFEITTLDELNLALSVISKREYLPQSYYSKITSVEYYDKLLFLAAVFIVLSWILKRLYLEELF